MIDLQRKAESDILVIIVYVCIRIAVIYWQNQTCYYVCVCVCVRIAAINSRIRLCVCIRIATISGRIRHVCAYQDCYYQ